jgi:hypothetical protein
LFARIKPEFDAVDTESLSVEVRKILWMAQTVDVPEASEDFKRLITLKENGVIDDDETRDLILYLVNKRHEK